MINRIPLKIACIYGAMGAIWILFSDEALHLVTSDQKMITNLSIAKGWLYVLLTAGLLFWLIRQHLVELWGAEKELSRQVDEYQISRNELFEANKTLNALFQSSPLAIVALDPSGTVTMWNRSAESLFGWLEEEVMGKTYPLVSPDRVRQIEKDIEIPIQEAPLRDVTGRRLTKTGDYLDVSISTAPLHGQAGEVTGMIVMLTDITERVRAEAALQQSELRYLSIFGASPIAIGIGEIESGRLIEVNKAWLQLFGYDRQEVIGRNTSELDLYANADERKQITHVLQKQGVVINREIPMRRKSGDIIDVLYSAEIVDLGPTSYLQVMMTDITERKHKDKILRESEERFRMVFEHSIDAIMLTRTDGSVIAANPESCRLLGMSEEEICRTGRPGLVDTEDHRADEMLEERNRTGRCRGEITMIKGDGSRFPAEISSAVFSDQEGGQKTSLIIRDVSERKNLENQLLHSRKMEAIGTLAGGIAHDFNNMLAVIRGLADLSKLKVSEEDRLWEHLNMISKAADRSTEITRQLLAFSRKEIISPRPVNLNSLIIETEKTLLRLIGEDIKLTFKPAASLWTVKLDPSQVDQILINLAVNARDAMPEGGHLVIATSNAVIKECDAQSALEARPGDYVRLTVTDSGVGMERHVMEHIFEPFYTTKGVGKGTGLGLATVYGIASQNHGFIKVSSQPGWGTTFDIFFPRLKKKAVNKTALLHPAASGEGTVLVVEDDELVRGMISLTLKEIGYEVILAETPHSAIRICENRDTKIDVILSDMIMPEMNGKEMMNVILSLRPGIKVLFMSGYSPDFVAQRGVAPEGLHFIQKPFDVNLLSAKLEEAMMG